MRWLRTCRHRGCGSLRGSLKEIVTCGRTGVNCQGGRAALCLAPVFEHRLLLIAEAFPPSIGGIQSYLAGLWGAFPPAQSFVVAAQQPGDQVWDAAQPYRVTRVSTRAWAYPRWRPALQAARAIVHRERIEAVVCGKALFEGRAALRLQEEFGVPFVVCTYAMELETWRRHARYQRQLRAVLARARKVLTINEQSQALLRRLGVAEQRLVKLYPGVAEDAFAAPSGIEEFRDRLGLRGKRVITAVGRLVPRKGFAVLINAFAELQRAVPTSHLLIVGDGPLRTALADRVAERSLGGAVSFLGDVPPDELRRAVSVAEVFALTPIDDPRDREGFGIVYTEAAALGKPVVASRTGGIPEAVLDEQTGLLVPPGDVAATAAALVRLFREPELRKRLGAAARARADKEFHWRGRALVFQGMIHALLAEREIPVTKSQ